jgi:hypothetical protein
MAHCNRTGDYRSTAGHCWGTLGNLLGDSRQLWVSRTGVRLPDLVVNEKETKRLSLIEKLKSNKSI